MLRLIFTCLITVLFLTGCQTNSNIATVPNSKVERFHSQHIGDYKISTYWPNKPVPKGGWPVIYLLDGDSYFLTANSILTSQSCERCAMQDGVIVAIDYWDNTRRALDYLPKPDTLTLEVLPNRKVNFPEAYGGADAFFDFIEQELKPEIEKRFAINKTEQTIFGHSYGGLFVLHSFLKQPHTFSTYIASSPSVWFSGRYIFNEVDQFIKLNKDHPLDKPVNLLISVGGNEQSLTLAEKKLPQAKQQELTKHRQNRGMVDGTRDLFQLLQQTNIKNLQLNYIIYPNQTHQTSPIIALQDGIQVAFQR